MMKVELRAAHITSADVTIFGWRPAGVHGKSLIDVSLWNVIYCDKFYFFFKYIVEVNLNSTC